MKVIELELPGLLLLETDRFGDNRGWFSETWQQDRYAAVGLPGTYVQDNVASSSKGVLRGLHAQEPYPQGKLVQVYRGRVFDVVVDLRVGSPAFGRWQGIILDGEKSQQFYVPPGFAHGYYVLSEEALFGYKCTDLYHPETQFSVRWNDPEIGIEWPLDGAPVLSEKDENARLFSELDKSGLTLYQG